MKSLFTGGSTTDFSIIQGGLNLLIGVWVGDSPLTGKPEVSTEDATFDGVRVLVHQQTESRGKKRPAVVFFHGGGLTVGSAGNIQIMHITEGVIVREQSKTREVVPSAFWTVPKLRRVDNFTNARPSIVHSLFYQMVTWILVI